MINALVVLLSFQLGGEIAARLLALPIPGPVLGAAALVAVLLVRGTIPPALKSTAGVILTNLSLLFVPAAVGVIEYRAVFADYGLALVATLLVSTLVAMAAAALTFRAASRR